MNIARCHEDEARKLVAPGWPAVESNLEALFHWLEDPNCTAYRVIREFFESVGAPLAPHFKHYLETPRDGVTDAVLSVIGGWPRESVVPLEHDLLRLAQGFDVEDRHLAALEILARHRIGDQDRLLEVVRQKKLTATNMLEELDQVENHLKSRDVR